MNPLWELVGQQFTVQLLYTIVTKAIWIAIIIGIGFLGISAVTRLLLRGLKSANSSPHVQIVTQKIIFYIGITTILINTAHVLGFDLSVLLGAAGVAGVAIGFASQTSMSNLISGLFLLSEHFLKIGDQIICDTIEGTVESIDLFSVKVKTHDGKLVRIPNERLLKTHVIDVTYYNARRTKISIAVPTHTPSDKLHAVIDTVIRTNKLIEQDPHYSIHYESLSAHAHHLVIKAWARHDSFIEMENSLITQLYEALAHADLKPLYVNRHK